VFISGQIPLKDGKPQFIGKVGDGISLEEAQAAAKLCGVNVLAQLSAACDGNLDRVVRCLKLGVFVNAVPDYTQQPEVANGASDLMVAVFGDAGKHARAAVGVGSLPRGVAVEVEAVFEIS
jgi:enamine deaminase RidA (YjgF/YER057c/UK114 family)